MFSSDDVMGVYLTMHIEDEQALFLLLAADGTVNRMGVGVIDDSEKQLFIASESPTMFETLKSRIQPETVQWEGGYADPQPTGQVCRLTVGFINSEGEESVCRFQYRSESQGPPPDICKFVTEAIEITDPWYEKQKQRIS